MSAAQDQLNVAAVDERPPFWLGEQFWNRLNRLEARHQRAQSEHEAVRRGLDSLQRARSSDLNDAWQRYCEVIAELDRTTAELEALRTRPE